MPGKSTYNSVPAALSFRSLKRAVGKRNWSRMGSGVLAVIVGLTLTLICQGHDIGGVHLGPHLTFLGMGGHNHSQVAQAAQTASISGSDETNYAEFEESYMSYSMPGMDMAHYFSLSDFTVLQALLPAEPAVPASASAGANLPSAVTIPPMESASLSMFTSILLLALSWRNQSLVALDVAAIVRRKSQTWSLAEAPPPRAV